MDRFFVQVVDLLASDGIMYCVVLQENDLGIVKFILFTRRSRTQSAELTLECCRGNKENDGDAGTSCGPNYIETLSK